MFKSFFQSNISKLLISIFIYIVCRLLLSFLHAYLKLVDEIMIGECVLIL